MRFPIVRLLAGVYSLLIRAKTDTFTANKTLQINGDWSVGQIPQIDNSDPTILKWISPGTLGGGTVSNVTSNNDAIVVTNNSTTPVIDLATQNANTVWAGPTTGAAAKPTFRSLVVADIPNLSADKITSGVFDISCIPVGTTSTTVAVGNDSRFHTQNTDAGTSQATFYIGGVSGPRLKNNSGSVEVRNSADSDFADLVVKNLFVRGTQVIIDSNQVNIGDNILSLNADYTGSAPTENAGLSINRSTATNGNASLIWDESTDTWKAGWEGSEVNLGRIYRTTFTSASLSSGVLTVTHNLGQQYVAIMVYDNSGLGVMPQITVTSANALTLDFSDATVTGTWQVVVIG